jgi:hypothetical protein
MSIDRDSPLILSGLPDRMGTNPCHRHHRVIGMTLPKIERKRKKFL